jgi:Na+-transporting methylmalonyl-CoA/oxaloacetate decarboxylase gamma subunit
VESFLILFYLDNGFSDKRELAVLFSLGTGLVLLLIILISVLYCRRQGIKKSQEEHSETTKTETVTEQPQLTPTITCPGKPSISLPLMDYVLTQFLLF